MKLKLSRLLPSAALFCLLIASCKKEDAVSTSTPSSTLTAQNARVTSMIGAMTEASDEETSDMFADESTASTGKAASACPERTFSPNKTAFPRTVTSDYGTGCTDVKGRFISGKKIVNWKADFHTAPAGTILSVVTYSNYYVNGINIAGSVTNKVVTAGVPGPFAFRQIYARSISDATGNVSTFLGTTLNTQVIGDINSAPADRGFSSKVNNYGVEQTPGEATVAWAATSANPTLPIKLGSCASRSSGLLQICLVSLEKTTKETLDFGNGDCDNKATLTINSGSPITITLPFRFFTSYL